MTTTYSSWRESINLLKEDALLNVERLFIYWKLDYEKIDEYEYDFLSPFRIDNTLGACRFNAFKGYGADFAHIPYSQSDFESVGKGFDREDFEFAKNKSISYAFDIIGLCQRVYGLETYKEGAKRLRTDLAELAKVGPIQRADLDAAFKREQAKKEKAAARISFAERLLKYCYDYRKTIGESYLWSRGLDKLEYEPEIRFHRAIMCAETNKPLPAIVFPIRESPGGEVKGIHRIYIKGDGSGKADIHEPKMALGSVKGNGIWFGKPGETLYLAEGPENALTLRVFGAEFVVCAINATNMPNLSIPEYVRHIVVCPDPDKAGITYSKKCQEAYKKIKVTVRLPRKVEFPNGKLADLNDLLMLEKKHGR